jgi:hypothetical protein
MALLLRLRNGLIGTPFGECQSQVKINVDLPECPFGQPLDTALAPF